MTGNDFISDSYNYILCFDLYSNNLLSFHSLQNLKINTDSEKIFKGNFKTIHHRNNGFDLVVFSRL